VLFGHFSGHWRCGSGGGWKVPEKGTGLKCYLGVLVALKAPYCACFGARAIKTGHLSHSAFLGWAYGKGEAHFHKLFSEN